METWIDLFWFSIIQLVVYALLGQFFDGASTEGLSLNQMILVGFVYWEVVRITQYSITLGVMWDVWSRSFSTLFVTPLTVTEFMIGQAITGFIKTLAVFGLLFVTLLIFFKFNLAAVGLVGVIGWIPLLLFSWAVGVFVVGLVVRFGTNIQSLAWGLIYLLQPISAVLYPLDALPSSVRWIAYASPITYVMENIRLSLRGAPVNWSEVVGANFLALLYLLASIYFFSRILKWSKKTGQFARLDA